MKPGRVFPGVGVGAVVVHDDRLLMVQRAGAHGAGTWSIPGGWLEMWEDPLRAAEREVAEETGVIVQARERSGWGDAHFVDDGVHAITLFVLCDYLSGEPRILEPDKCPDVEWVPLEVVDDRRLFRPFDSWWASLLTPITGETI